MRILYSEDAFHADHTTRILPDESACPADSYACPADSYFELYWLDQTRNGIHGVLLFISTAMSKQTERVYDWEHFFMPGAVSTWIVGEAHGECLGIVGEAFPHSSIASADMQVFLLATFPKGRPYHGWVGHSRMCFDTVHYAVDLYLQGYPELHSSRYIKFTLLDINEPCYWYKALLYRREGTCIVADPIRRHVTG